MRGFISFINLTLLGLMYSCGANQQALDMAYLALTQSPTPTATPTTTPSDDQQMMVIASSTSTVTTSYGSSNVITTPISTPKVCEKNNAQGKAKGIVEKCELDVAYASAIENPVVSPTPIASITPVDSPTAAEEIPTPVESPEASVTPTATPTPVVTESPTPTPNPYIIVSACVDGSDWIQVENGKLTINHVDFWPIGTHPDCPTDYLNAVYVDGVRYLLNGSPIYITNIDKVRSVTKINVRGDVYFDGEKGAQLFDNSVTGAGVYTVKLWK